MVVPGVESLVSGVVEGDWSLFKGGGVECTGSALALPQRLAVGE
jgi:hypothetical protein